MVASLIDLADNDTGALYALYWWLVSITSRLAEFDLDLRTLQQENSCLYDVLLAKSTDCFSRLFLQMCRCVPKLT